MKIGKLAIGLVLLGIGVLLLVGVVKFASVLGFLMFYPYAVQRVTGYGLNPYLAEAIGLVVGAGLWFVVLKLFLVWREKKRLLGFGILVGFYTLHLLLMFLIPGGALVHPLTGERQFCAINKLTGRIERFETAQFDRFGEKAKECTLDQIEKFEREKAFAEGENLEVPIGTVRHGFISPVTGAPLFFYCEDASNAPHFYVASGYCPWGGQLQAVTKEVLQKYASISTGSVEITSPPALRLPAPSETTQTKEGAGINVWAFYDKSETKVLFWVLFVICVLILIIPLLQLVAHESVVNITVAGASVILWLLICILFANMGLLLLNWNMPVVLVFIIVICVTLGLVAAYFLFLKEHFQLF